ncbi:calcineurin-like phosphoesterase family protein [Sphingomonas psychrotolerans]|uniref:Calcineurin-like phosphoesterase family protein n=1 Tax=Sphingomonas psychrotolerans TaxID=1327635 RepID=A0ABU3MYJ5_9SPHN|nr:calcineurin-like phosphoesterase family protein [Sphingomonas psychrotolerans]MDT8757193.1 calcineurin-like phosphoesterase family protein [Sphingomonas psychrotolerans]
MKRWISRAAGLIAAAVVLTTMPARAQAAAPIDTPWFAGIEIIRKGAAHTDRIAGTVFDDRNRNGELDAGERGLVGVKVSNGREVVKTDFDGHYVLPVRSDMSVFVIQPSGWRVPTNRSFVPQFAYTHKPAGSPKKMRFGGLPPTGPLPAAINFPLAPSEVGGDFNCAVLGDVQVYSGDEIGYARDSLVRELADRDGTPPACLLALGDLVGDDLGLIPRLEEVLGALKVPQWWVQGNHDYDSDADRDADSSDTWRRDYGPTTYAFEIGNVLFIGLDNVSYPCGEQDNRKGTRPFCVEYPQKSYNGRFTDDQMAFMANLVAATDPTKLIVLGHHIPLVGFDNRKEWAHQTQNARELHSMLRGRKALDLSGHSHTLENLAPGDSFEGWNQAVGVTSIPFRHIVAGAVAGDWWGGDYDVNGIPMSLQGDGSPRGYIDMRVRGSDYALDYRAIGERPGKAMWLSVNTPAFRDWAATLLGWRNADRNTRPPTPPLSVQDLPDEKLLTPADLAAGSFLTANVWLGDTQTEVRVAIDGGASAAMIRTQEARGEPSRDGPEFADPFALQRQLTVARTAITSRSGTPETQGMIQGRQERHVPGPPQPQGSVMEHSSHLWRYRLPTTLAPGIHRATVAVTRPQGSPSRETLIFEVRTARPARTFRFDVWDAYKDGTRVPEAVVGRPPTSPRGPR